MYWFDKKIFNVRINWNGFAIEITICKIILFHFTFLLSIILIEENKTYPNADVINFDRVTMYPGWIIFAN